MWLTLSPRRPEGVDLRCEQHQVTGQLKRDAIFHRSPRLPIHSARSIQLHRALDRQKPIFPTTHHQHRQHDLSLDDDHSIYHSLLQVTLPRRNIRTNRMGFSPRMLISTHTLTTRLPSLMNTPTTFTIRSTIPPQAPRTLLRRTKPSPSLLPDRFLHPSPNLFLFHALITIPSRSLRLPLPDALPWP